MPREKSRHGRVPTVHTSRKQQTVSRTSPESNHGLMRSKSTGQAGGPRQPRVWTTANGGPENGTTGHHHTNGEGFSGDPSYHRTLSWLKSMNDVQKAERHRRLRRYDYYPSQYPTSATPHHNSSGGSAAYTGQPNGYFTALKIPSEYQRYQHQFYANELNNNKSNGKSSGGHLQRLKELNATISEMEILSHRLRATSVFYVLSAIAMLFCDVIYISLAKDTAGRTTSSEVDVLYPLYIALIGAVGFAVAKRSSAISSLLVVLLGIYVPIHLLVPLSLPISKRIMEAASRFAEAMDYATTYAPFNGTEARNVSMAQFHVVGRIQSDKMSFVLAMQVSALAYIIFGIACLIVSIPMLIIALKLHKLL